jgi:hypothetical protein
LTRIIACWRAGQTYQLRDVDGTPVTIDQARQIIAERYAIPKDPSVFVGRPDAGQFHIIRPLPPLDVFQFGAQDRRQLSVTLVQILHRGANRVPVEEPEQHGLESTQLPSNAGPGK